jgi:hypothetical protein
MIRQKQSLVYKVPSGVTFLSHVYGVAMIFHFINVSGKYEIWGDKEFLSFICEKRNGSRHLVFWSLGTLTGLRDRIRELVV